MKNIIFSIILLMMTFSVANAQTELKPLKVGNVTISYNQEGAANIEVHKQKQISYAIFTYP